MPNTADMKPNLNIYALFKGPSGAGKTVGALSFPDPYLFDFDHKMPNIAIKHFRGKKIEYDTYSDSGDIFDRLLPWVTGQSLCPFETLIFDSFTSLARIVMNTTANIKGETIKDMMARRIARKGSDKEGKKKADMIEPLSYDYYNSEVRFVDWLLSATKQLWAAPGFPNNIIFTAHIIEARSKPNIETKVVTVTRSIMAIGTKAPAIIPTEFDELYMFATAEEGGLGADDSVTRRLMFTQTVGEDDAKTALPLAKRTDFTNANLYDLLMGQIKGSEMFA